MYTVKIRAERNFFRIKSLGRVNFYNAEIYKQMKTYLMRLQLADSNTLRPV